MTAAHRRIAVGSAEIGDEPSKDADIRYRKNPQPDFEIGNLLLFNVKLGHDVNNSRSHFCKAYTNLGPARATL
jgi:hypothetical protein